MGRISARRLPILTICRLCSYYQEGSMGPTRHFVPVLLVMWVIGGSAQADNTITLQDTAGDAHAVQLNPGDLYAVTLEVNATDSITTIEGDLGCSASGIVELTSESFAIGWDAPGGLLAVPAPFSPPYSLDTPLHLGSGRTNLDGQSGSFPFATLTIRIKDGAPPGQY